MMDQFVKVGKGWPDQDLNLGPCTDGKTRLTGSSALTTELPSLGSETWVGLLGLLVVFWDRIAVTTGV